MTWVKLCGMTRRADVEVAVDAGADAVGFVLHPGSPRHISVEAVPALAAGIAIGRFLVTVDADPDTLVALARAAGASGVQPHGTHARESAEAALAAGLEVLYPVPVKEGPPDLSAVPQGARPLLDTGGTGLHGGTGKAFAWEHAAAVPGEFVLAGGLTPESVASAVAATAAWGVDVASGVERSPGIKDHEAMRRFVEAVR